MVLRESRRFPHHGARARWLRTLGRRALPLGASTNPWTASRSRTCSTAALATFVLLALPSQLALSRSSPPAAALPTSAGACELVVVRHGETDWNRALRVQGSTDIALNDKGRMQANKCAEALARDYGGARSPGAVYASGLQRAVVTASAIAAALTATFALAASGGGEAAAEPAADLSGRSVEVLSDARLNEWDLGVLEGLRKDEAAAKHEEDWTTFSRWCSARVAPEQAARRVTDGECMDDVRQRAVACLEEACRASIAAGGEEPRPVIAVTHGGVLGQLLRHAEETGGGAAAVAQPAVNACISRFLVAPGGRWRILSWADTSHLDGAAAPVAADYDAADEECPVEESG